MFPQLYGLSIHFQLLSTSGHPDAVTFRCWWEAPPERDFHPSCARGIPSALFRPFRPSRLGQTGLPPWPFRPSGCPAPTGPRWIWRSCPVGWRLRLWACFPFAEGIFGGRLRGIQQGSWPRFTSDFWRCPLSMNRTIFDCRFAISNWIPNPQSAIGNRKWHGSRFLYVLGRT